MKNTDLRIIIPKWEKDNTIKEKIIKKQKIPRWYYNRTVKVIELQK